MLRTNLASRPFYNVRVVQVVLVIATALVIALTALNVVQILRLTTSQSTLGARAAEATREAARLRTEAVRIRAQINPEELQVVANAAREANAIIDQRAFSWTDLLAEFEATLPPDVRITSVQPRLDEKTFFVVSIVAEARRSEDLDAFIEALEQRGTFHNVLSRQEQTNTEGLIESVIEGAYVPRAEPEGAPSPQGTGG
jgi:hypothetical protein